MQTSGGVDDDHVGVVGFRAAEGVESYRCRVAAHLLFHDVDADPLAPDAELFDGCCTEGVGGSEIHFLASVLKLVGEFADGGGLSHTIDTHYEDDVRLMVGGKVPIVVVVGVVF